MLKTAASSVHDTCCALPPAADPKRRRGYQVGNSLAAEVVGLLPLAVISTVLVMTELLISTLVMTELLGSTLVTVVGLASGKMMRVEGAMVLRPAVELLESGAIIKLLMAELLLLPIND